MGNYNLGERGGGHGAAGYRHAAYGRCRPDIGINKAPLAIYIIRLKKYRIRSNALKSAVIISASPLSSFNASIGLP